MALRNQLRKGRKLLTLLTSGVYRRGLWYGVGAAIEHKDVIRSLSPDFVIDVGANVGQFSLLARKEAPAARIIAFEPLKDAAARYRSLFRHDGSVLLHEYALGNERGMKDMHVSARRDSSSLLPIAAVQSEYFPGTEEVGREPVQVAPLTDFIKVDDLPSRALLKIDVQGFEYRVLQSAEPLLPRLAWIYAELSSVAFYEGLEPSVSIISYLDSRGYDLIARYNPSFGPAGDVVQADYLFVRRTLQG